MQPRTIHVALYLIVCLLAVGCAGQSDDDIKDRWVSRLVSLSENRTPADPDAASFGMDAASGLYIHPAAILPIPGMSNCC